MNNLIQTPSKSSNYNIKGQPKSLQTSNNEASNSQEQKSLHNGNVNENQVAKEVNSEMKDSQDRTKLEGNDNPLPESGQAGRSSQLRDHVHHESEQLGKEDKQNQPGSAGQQIEIKKQAQKYNDQPTPGQDQNMNDSDGAVGYHTELERQETEEYDQLEKFHSNQLYRQNHSSANVPQCQPKHDKINIENPNSQLLQNNKQTDQLGAEDHEMTNEGPGKSEMIENKSNVIITNCSPKTNDPGHQENNYSRDSQNSKSGDSKFAQKIGQISMKNNNDHQERKDYMLIQDDIQQNENINNQNLVLNPEIEMIKEADKISGQSSHHLRNRSRGHSESGGRPKLLRENNDLINRQQRNRQQQDIQKLIEEVTKKEEKWTKNWDEHLVSLTSHFKVENIPTVTEKLNQYIDEQRAKLPADQQASFCPIKTEVECMDRWLLLRNNTEDGTVKQIKGNWTPEEDMILKKKVAEYGLKKWKEIATFLPGRIGKQCRERWYNNVDPNLNKDKWTIAEDLQLMELHKLYGNKWVQIQKHMPGRIDNDIKNRFNASLRKYKTFEQYVEANDRKREKSKKKYYWRQHYELRNVNNSKRLPLNDQDKEFKDMAQQKIQIEVGSNLPPLKNDLIIEKKRELEEYQHLKKLKAQFREEKRLQKLKEKSSKKKNWSAQRGDPALFEKHQFEISNFNLHEARNNISQPFNERIDLQQNMQGGNQYAQAYNNGEQVIYHYAKNDDPQIPSQHTNAQRDPTVFNNFMDSANLRQYVQADQPPAFDAKIQSQSPIFENRIPKYHPQAMDKNATDEQIWKVEEQRLSKVPSDLRDLSHDRNFKEIFKRNKASQEELLELRRTQSTTNAFKQFITNRQYKELFMPTKNAAPEERQQSRNSSCTNHQQQPAQDDQKESLKNLDTQRTVEEPIQPKNISPPSSQQPTIEAKQAFAKKLQEINMQKIFQTRQISNKEQSIGAQSAQANQRAPPFSLDMTPPNNLEKEKSDRTASGLQKQGAFQCINYDTMRKALLDQASMEQKAFEIAKNVEMITKRADQKSLLKLQNQERSAENIDYELKNEMPGVKVLLKRYELLKKIQDQVSAIRKIRENQQKSSDIQEIKQTQKSQLSRGDPEDLDEQEIRNGLATKRQRTENQSSDLIQLQMGLERDKDAGTSKNETKQYKIAKSYIKLPQVQRPSPQQNPAPKQENITSLMNNILSKSMANNPSLFKKIVQSSRINPQIQRPSFSREKPPCIIQKPTDAKISQAHQQIFQNLKGFSQKQKFRSPNTLIKADGGHQSSQTQAPLSQVTFGARPQQQNDQKPKLDIQKFKNQLQLLSMPKIQEILTNMKKGSAANQHSVSSSEASVQAISKQYSK